MISEQLSRYEKDMAKVLSSGFGVAVDDCYQFYICWVIRVDPDCALIGIRNGSDHYVVCNSDTKYMFSLAFEMLPNDMILGDFITPVGGDRDMIALDYQNVTGFFKLRKVLDGWFPSSKDYYFES